MAYQVTALKHLLSFMVKEDEAPCSAEMHLMQALISLADGVDVDELQKILSSDQEFQQKINDARVIIGSIY